MYFCCYHLAQLNLEEFTLRKTLAGWLGHLHPNPVLYITSPCLIDQTYLGTTTICNYKCYLLNLTSPSIIQLSTQGCTDKGPPLKSQGLLKKTGHMRSQMFIGLQCCKYHSEHLIQGVSKK